MSESEEMKIIKEEIKQLREQVRSLQTRHSFKIEDSIPDLLVSDGLGHVYNVFMPRIDEKSYSPRTDDRYSNGMPLTTFDLDGGYTRYYPDGSIMVIMTKRGKDDWHYISYFPNSRIAATETKSGNHEERMEYSKTGSVLAIITTDGDNVERVTFKSDGTTEITKHQRGY
jgi:hypothetical protein